METIRPKQSKLNSEAYFSHLLEALSRKRESSRRIPSRGLAPSKLINCELWNSGPEWLSNKSNLPERQDHSTEDIPTESMQEMKIADRKRLENTTQNTLLVIESEYNIAKVVTCENFSSFQRLVRVTVLVLKFVKILRKKCQSREVGLDDIKEAELLWLKEVQASLKRNPKYECWCHKFGLFTDNRGLVRCGGRVSNAKIKYETKHPILLEGAHQATTLIVEECHRRVQHNGVKETFTELRSRYWLVKGRQFIRKVIHRCVTCRRIEGKAYNPRAPPPFPKCRVTPYLYRDRLRWTVVCTKT